jgi:Tfp pilus assembly protein PilF
LKRAEQEKGARQPAAPAVAAANAEAPRVAAATAAKSVLELQPVAEPARDSSLAAREAQHIAAAMMKAKAEQPKPSGSKAGVVWAIVGAIFVLLGAGAAYVWYAMQPVRTPAPISARQRALPPPVASPVDPVSAAPGAASASAPRFLEPPRVATVTPDPQPGGAQPAQLAPRTPAAADADAQQLMTNLLKEAATPVAPPVRFARAEGGSTVSPEVRSGYAALAAGDLATARRTYLAALGIEPSNLDALLGVATVEARLGNRESARAYYRKVLDIDPRNPTALAGLAAIAPAAAPDALESQLRSDLARSPDSAALHFALGGLYASQSRWTEAQARFFDAHRLDPANGDIAFNLAVSLDHLNQPRLAAQYYARALESARGGSVQFDAAAARRRLAQIAP